MKDLAEGKENTVPHSHNRQKHTTTLEEIDEERDSLQDEESNGSSSSLNLHRKNGLASTSAMRHDESKDEESFESKNDDGVNFDDIEVEKRCRSASVSNADIEEHNRLEHLHNSEKPTTAASHRYARHSSIDQKYSGIPIKTHQNSDHDDDIDRYYERNNYTVTGPDRSADFFQKLPVHLQHRMNPNHNIDASSRLSTPGALGEPVMPSNRRFDKSLYWFAFHRKQIGFRHLSIVLLVLIYTLLGACLFYNIESRHEKLKTLRHVRNLEDLLTVLAENITDSVNDPHATTNITEMKDYIREAYVALMKLEGQYKGSTYYKLEDTENNWKWTFESAFFFSMNVYTTTGYGSIAPESELGQLFVCIYGFIFVPVTLVALRDLGQFFLVHLTKLYAHGIQKFRELSGDKSVDEDEIIRLPISACLMLLIGYLSACTIFIYVYDDWLGSEANSGISMFLSFYFSFVSLSTIGLGDVMPNNATFSPIISIIFFFGMALTKVVNRNTYIAVENGIFGTMTLMENKLDSIVASPTKVTDAQEQPPNMMRSMSVDADQSPEEANTMLNNFTVRSIATLMKSNADIYGGGFGRVQLRRGDLLNTDNQNTVNSISQLRQRNVQPKDNGNGNNV